MAATHKLRYSEEFVTKLEELLPGHTQLLAYLLREMEAGNSVAEKIIEHVTSRHERFPATVRNVLVHDYNVSRLSELLQEARMLEELQKIQTMVICGQIDGIDRRGQAR